MAPPHGATVQNNSNTTPHTGAFAHERAATSLQDLDIVRKIVEREGCLEALAQLLASHTRAQRGPPAQNALAASATLAAAPMVVQSLLDQLRGVSVLVVEGIDRWRRAHQGHAVFQWRGLNYLAKMLRDTDFVALHGAAAAQLDAFRGLRLTRNPFLAPLHLDHAALREPSPELACRLAVCVGSVDMKRIHAACRRLREEEEALAVLEGGSGGGGRIDRSGSRDLGTVQPTTGTDAADTLTATGFPATSTPTPSPTLTTTQLHWSHRPVALAASASAPSLLRGRDMSPSPDTDERAAKAFDVELAKELVFQHEHELGAMKEELAVVQRRLQKELTLAPDRKRQLTTRAAALAHDIKLRTGDLFHRRNELQRKEAVLKMDRRRAARAKAFARALDQPPPPHHHHPEPHEPQDDAQCDGRDAPAHFTALETFQAALQADELRRQDLIDKFATFAKHQAALSVTKRRLQSLRSPLPSPSSSRASFTATSPGGARHHVSPTDITAMSTTDVETFVAALPLGDDARDYGAALRARGIDGALLAQAQESDLEELGVSIRLHRVKILDAVRQQLTLTTTNTAS